MTPQPKPVWAHSLFRLAQFPPCLDPYLVPTHRQLPRFHLPFFN